MAKKLLVATCAAAKRGIFNTLLYILERTTKRAACAAMLRLDGLKQPLLIRRPEFGEHRVVKAASDDPMLVAGVDHRDAAR